MTRLLALAFAIGALASCGRPIPVEPCRIISVDTSFGPAGQILAIVTKHEGACRNTAQLREAPRLDTPPAEHDSPPEHITCALTPVEHRWTILGVTYIEIVEECY